MVKSPEEMIAEEMRMQDAIYGMRDYIAGEADSYPGMQQPTQPAARLPEPQTGPSQGGGSANTSPDEDLMMDQDEHLMMDQDGPLMMDEHTPHVRAPARQDDLTEQGPAEKRQRIVHTPAPSARVRKNKLVRPGEIVRLTRHNQPTPPATPVDVVQERRPAVSEKLTKKGKRSREASSRCLCERNLRVRDPITGALRAIDVLPRPIQDRLVRWVRKFQNCGDHWRSVQNTAFDHKMCVGTRAINHSGEDSWEYDDASTPCHRCTSTRGLAPGAPKRPCMRLIKVPGSMTLYSRILEVMPRAGAANFAEAYDYFTDP